MQLISEPEDYDFSHFGKPIMLTVRDARTLGFEPRLMVLETISLPLTYVRKNLIAKEPEGFEPSHEQNPSSRFRVYPLQPDLSTVP